MIIVNNKKYNNYDFKVSSDNFTACKYGDGKQTERSGTAPYIKFCINDEILIGIEMNYSFDMFESLKIDEVIDITKYITDINFKDSSGWQTYIDELVECNVVRKNKKEFEFIITVNDKLEEFNIKIDSIVEIF